MTVSGQLPRPVRGVQETTRETPRQESPGRGGGQDRHQGSEEGHGRHELVWDQTGVRA